jgi:hypothetical protein
MSERKPVDPFSDINLDTFKNTAPKKPKSPIEKEAIREVAIQSKFQSRQPVAKREPHTAKTFSLFPDDTAIIKNALRSFMDYNASIQASSSDVVRAALHEFSRKPENEQVKLIEQYRARGKREYA